MKKNVKAMYVAPVVELLEARVEKGFAGSANGPELNVSGGPIADTYVSGSEMGADFVD